MKLIFVGDPHFRIKSSVYRVGDPYHTQLKKLDYILSLGEKQKADAVVFGGDIFHSPRESYELVYDLLDIFHKYKTPCYTIIGNHDVVGYNLDILKKSPLGILVQSGVLTLLDKDVVLPLNVVLRGIHFYSEHKDERYQFGKYKDYLKIVATHNMIVPLDSAPFDYVHPDKVITDANVVLCAHFHIPFDYVSNALSHRPRYVNPGIPMRWTINEANIEPKVALLNWDGNTYSVSYLPIPHEKNVFNLEKSAETKEDKKTIDNFVKALEETSFDANNLEESIIKYGECNDVDKSIVDELLIRIKSNRGTYGE